MKATNWNQFAVFLRWNRRLLTRYRHENWHFCWFYFNMDKPAAPKNRLNIHCCPIHQIDIPPAQILSSKSTISSKTLSGMVLLSNNWLTPLGWFTAWWRQSIWARATKRAKIKLRIHVSWRKGKVLYHGMASILPYKTKRRYLLTCKVSRYCL